MKKEEPTHTVMSYPLAKALMDSGMKHYFLGGVFDAIGDVAGSPFKGIAKGLTVQNDYNAQLAPTDHTNYGDYISGSAEDSFKIRQQQQMLADMLGEQARGEGPSVAQKQLAQTTGDTIQAQSALQAGQRGAGTNVGLIAKQASQQGADIQGKANQNAAILRAQEMMAARSALAQQQAAMQQGALGMFGSAGQLQNSQNFGNIENYRMMQGINSGVAGQNAQSVNDTTMGIISGASQAAAAAATGGKKFKGGEIPDHLHHMGKLIYPEQFSEMGGKVPGKSQYSGNDQRNDRVPALLSPGEVILPNSVTQSPDAPKKAAEFLRHLQSKKEVREKGYEKIASRKKKGS